MAEKGISIEEIAQLAGCSKATVSRALARDGAVSSSRAAAIRAYAEKAGYRPQPMRRGMNHTIGLVVASDDGLMPEDTYQNELLSAMATRLGAEGWHLQHEVIRRSDGLPALIRENRVDGVVLAGCPGRKICDAIRNLNFPAVVLDDRMERTGLPSVLADVRPSMTELVTHLREIGHRQIALIASAKKYPSVTARVEAFREAAGKRGATLQFTSGDVSFQQGQIATRQLFAAQRPTAVVYITDLLAIGGLIELARLGRSVPGDVSICGCDNTIFSRQLDPPLTTIDLNLAGAVQTAFNHLRTLILQGTAEPPKQFSIPTSVHWRASCSGVIQSITPLPHSVPPHPNGPA